MRKYKRTTKKEADFYSGKKSLKRNHWLCNKTKSDHVFELAYPEYGYVYRTGQYASWFKNVKTPQDWYDAYEALTKEQIEKGNWLKGTNSLRIRHWKCKECSKKAIDTERNPDKRIRQNLCVKK